MAIKISNVTVKYRVQVKDGSCLPYINDYSTKMLQVAVLVRLAKLLTVFKSLWLTNNTNVK